MRIGDYPTGSYVTYRQGRMHADSWIQSLVGVDNANTVFDQENAGVGSNDKGDL